MCLINCHGTAGAEQTDIITRLLLPSHLLTVTYLLVSAVRKHTVCLSREYLLNEVGIPLPYQHGDVITNLLGISDPSIQLYPELRKDLYLMVFIVHV